MITMQYDKFILYKYLKYPILIGIVVPVLCVFISKLVWPADNRDVFGIVLIVLSTVFTVASWVIPGFLLSSEYENTSYRIETQDHFSNKESYIQIGDRVYVKRKLYGFSVYIPTEYRNLDNLIDEKVAFSTNEMTV